MRPRPSHRVVDADGPWRGGMQTSMVEEAPAGLPSQHVPQVFDDSFRSPSRPGGEPFAITPGRQIERAASVGSSTRRSPTVERAPAFHPASWQDRPIMASRIATPEKPIRPASAGRSPQQAQLCANARRDPGGNRTKTAGRPASAGGQKGRSSPNMLGVRQQKQAATAHVLSFGR
eukprot:6068459-Amphidinium_carterae.1